MEHFQAAEDLVTTATICLAEAAEHYVLAMPSYKEQPVTPNEHLCVKRLIQIKAAIDFLHPDAEVINDRAIKPFNETPGYYAD